MPLEIRPEPPEDVREALAEAIERELGRSEPESAWWRAGLVESVGDDFRDVAVEIL